MNCKSFKIKICNFFFVTTRHAEFIYSIQVINIHSWFETYCADSFYCGDHILKGLLYVLSWSDGLASKDNFRFKTQVSFFFWFDLALQKCKQWPCSIRRLSAGGWPTACFVDTTIFLISEVHEQVHVGQPTSFYHLRWLSLFWFKHTTARTFFKTKI